MIDRMMMSLQTHVALTHIDTNPQPPETHFHTPSERDAVETASTVGRLRRRLAQMHLAPATQS
jgi:hypothetical protein